MDAVPVTAKVVEMALVEVALTIVRLVMVELAAFVNMPPAKVEVWPSPLIVVVAVLPT